MCLPNSFDFNSLNLGKKETIEHPTQYQRLIEGCHDGQHEQEVPDPDMPSVVLETKDHFIVSLFFF